MSILCRLGWHRWERVRYRQLFSLSSSGPLVTGRICQRCGAIRHVAVAP